MKALGALLVSALLGSCATVGGPPRTPVLEGYLTDLQVSALAETVDLPDPVLREAEERLEGKLDQDPETNVMPFDRWQLAIVHAELRPPEAAQHFDCVLGARFMARPRPALTRLMARLAIDAERISVETARRAPRDRPMVAMPGLTTCQRTTEAMRRSSSWPASGAVVGAAYGAAFAEMAPDRAEAARRMGRTLGESRVVCRMNWGADAPPGADLGQSLFNVAAHRPEFAADLAAARAEVVAARGEGLTNPGCAAERRALGVRPDAG